MKLMSTFDIKAYGFSRASNGEFGAYISDNLVIKFCGWSDDIIVLDKVSSIFGFRKTNAKIISRNNHET